ncbi:uncharacterized protein RAG0_00640 [Rhynchosporium agropyri]|uniref:Extracellular membrane protein CFEM domain-containing protein n=2 Tax=Rhynchosporium TaxID=38037 RepID=A0A1E1M8N3_RHYSE|nr:uncharacterized protein RAG0_00640 [Rhynchosporium agropyri]CZT45462.1 uncharacterized protein RSE6_05774 [Rhynchosporium secalis]
MQFSTLLSAACILLFATASVIPSSLVMRQSSKSRINIAPLLLGSCLAIGACYYNADEQGCTTAGCGSQSMLGSICSCNVNVQKALDAQLEKGKELWPVKCPY